MDLLSAFLAFGAGAGATRLLAGLREHRAEPAGLDDLLNWAFLVADGVAMQKDGSFLAGWCYRGPDAAASSASELGALSRHVADALLPYGDGWMFHVDAVRRPSATYAPPGAFPDAATALFDEERRRAFAGGRAFFETDHVLCCTYLPPPELYSRLGRLFIKGASGDKRASRERSLAGSDWEGVLANFCGALDDLESRLSAVLAMRRLSSSKLVTHLHACLTGLHHAVAAPAPGTYLGHVLSDQPLTGGFKPRVGTMHVRPVAASGFPPETRSGDLAFLSELGYGFRWSSRFIPLSPTAAAKEIRRQRMGWLSKRKGASALIREAATPSSRTRTVQKERDDALFMDGHAQTMVEDAAEAMARATSGDVRFGYHTGVVLVMEEEAERADAAATEVVKALRARGFTARIEDVNALEAYLGSLPGHGYPNLRRPLLSTPNVADLLPTTSVWPGHATCPSPYFPEGSPALLWAETAGTTPFRVNLHEGDVGHTLIVGATGAGKSTLVGTLLAQWFRYPEARAFLFDVGYSGYLLAKAAGGAHYDLATEEGGGMRLQPLRRIHQAEERAWATEWLEVLFDLQGVQVTPEVWGRVRRALELVAESPPEHRTLSELMVQIQDPALKEALRPYLAGGALGRLLDGGEESWQGNVEAAGNERYEVFELKHLMDRSDRALVPVLLCLFRRVERRLSAGRPTLIVIEEAWAALLRSLFAERIRRWLLTLRKENAAVVLVAHSPAQLGAVAQKEILTQSCPTRIFLPNPDATSPDAARLYAEMGLGAAEVALLARAQKKRDYYYASPSGRRLFSLGLGPVALSFLGGVPGKSMQETKQEADRLIEAHGAAWPGAWLHQRGLSAWAKAFRERSSGLHQNESYQEGNDETASLRAT